MQPSSHTADNGKVFLRYVCAYDVGHYFYAWSKFHSTGNDMAYYHHLYCLVRVVSELQIDVDILENIAAALACVDLDSIPIADSILPLHLDIADLFLCYCECYYWCLRGCSLQMYPKLPKKKRSVCVSCLLMKNSISFFYNQ